MLSPPVSGSSNDFKDLHCGMFPKPQPFEHLTSDASIELCFFLNCLAFEPNTVECKNVYPDPLKAWLGRHCAGPGSIVSTSQSSSFWRTCRVELPPQKGFYNFLYRYPRVLGISFASVVPKIALGLLRLKTTWHLESFIELPPEFGWMHHPPSGQPVGTGFHIIHIWTMGSVGAQCFDTHVCLALSVCPMETHTHTILSNV